MLVAWGCSRSLAPASPAHTTSRVAAAPAVTAWPSPPTGIPGDEPAPFLTPCPGATFSDPRPSHLFSPTLTSTFTFKWSPNVPAPSGPTPTRYRYKLFDEHGTDFDFITLLVRPDSLVRFYAPAFAGWTEVNSSVTQATLQNMDPSVSHVLVLIAMDDHGHFDNVPSFDRNFLFFHVSPALVVDKGNDGTR
jgi:hypothetical protein